MKYFFVRLLQKLEIRRQLFFADNPAGRRLLALAVRLHKRYPESRLIDTVWHWCLPF